MYIKKSEVDALFEAVDFISSNSDGAEDREYYDKLISTLSKLSKKARDQFHKQEARKKTNSWKRQYK